MTAYWFFFALPAIAALSPIYVKKDIDIFFWSLLFLTYVFVIGFRHQVGGDWGTYIIASGVFSERFNFLDFNIRADYAYEFINWLSHELSLGVYGSNVFSAIIFTLALFYFCSMQPNKWMGIIISFPVIILILGMGFTRQGVAFSFILLSIISLIKKQQFYFFIYIFLAVLFHKSSIIFTPMYLLSISYKKNNIFQIVFFVIFSLFILYLVWSDFSHLFRTYVIGKLSNAAYPGGLISKGGFIRAGLNIVPAILMIFFRNEITNNKVERKIFLLFSFASIGSLFSVQLYSVVTDRIVLYISILQVFVFSRLNYIFKNDNTVKILNICIFLFYSLVLYVWLNHGINSHAWIPYMNLFFHN